jgi:hypothetical protein
MTVGFFTQQSTSYDKHEPFYFGKHGESIQGIVARVGKQFQGKDFKTGTPKVNKNGEPVYTLPVDIRTTEDTRTVYVEGNGMTNAIGNALRGQGLADLEEGLAIKISRLDKAKTEAGFWAWQWDAQVRKV